LQGATAPKLPAARRERERESAAAAKGRACVCPGSTAYARALCVCHAGGLGGLPLVVVPPIDAAERRLAPNLSTTSDDPAAAEGAAMHAPGRAPSGECRPTPGGSTRGRHLHCVWVSLAEAAAGEGRRRTCCITQHWCQPPSGDTSCPFDLMPFSARFSVHF
jgi:hypothetical protein